MRCAAAMAVAFLALVMLTACGVVVTTPERLSWAVDPKCLPPTERQQRSLAVAVELWAAWGVELPEESNVDAADLLVCFTAAQPFDGYAGWASNQEMRIYLDGRQPDEHDRDSVTVHEFGHILLEGGPDLDHLPSDHLGIMASSVMKQPNAAAWTDDDREHLIALGLVPVE